MLSRSSRVGEEVNGMEEKKGLDVLINEKESSGIIIKLGKSLDGLSSEDAQKILDKDHEEIKKDYKKMGISI